MTIGQLIQQARKEAGLTQVELGARLGVSGSMIAQWENDLRKPKNETAWKIYAALWPADSAEALHAYLKQEERGLFQEAAGSAKGTMTAFEQDKKLQLEILFDRLNKTGKSEAVKRVGELTQIPQYTEPEK